MRRFIKYGGLWWLGAALLIRVLFALWPGAWGQVWFEGAFPLVRKYQVALYSIWLLPGYYVLVISVLIWLAWRFPRKWLHRQDWLRFGRRLLNLLAGLTASFLMLWGYNYLDPGLGHRMGLERSTSPELLADAYLQVLERAMAHRNTLIPSNDTTTTIEDLAMHINPEEVEAWVRAVLSPYGYPTGETVRTRYPKPEGVLHRLSISGIYNPWTGEANVEPGQGSLPLVFTTAHEMAHAFGITSEAEANFTAWLACLSANEPLANYAAEYALWRSLAREVHKAYTTEEVEALAAAIPMPLRRDRDAIWRKALRHKAYFPEVSEVLNDTYLKVQGIEAGTGDYDAFVGLWFAWERSEKAKK